MPAGTGSLTTTWSSGVADGFETVTVKVTVPPTSGRGLSTVLSSARSTGVGGGGVPTVIVLWADSLPGWQSNVPVSETVATFVKVPACGASAVMESVAEPPLGTSPTAQSPVVGS